MEPAGAVSEPAAADFAARSLLSDVGGMLHLPSRGLPLLAGMR